MNCWGQLGEPVTKPGLQHCIHSYNMSGSNFDPDQGTTLSCRNPLHCSTVKCSGVQCSAVQFSSVQCIAVHPREGLIKSQKGGGREL